MKAPRVRHDASNGNASHSIPRHSMKALFPAGIVLFCALTSALTSIVSVALRFVATGSFNQQRGHTENGVFLPDDKGGRRYLPLYPPQLTNATPGLGFAACLVNLVVSAIVSAGAAYVIKRKRSWKLLLPEHLALLVVLSANLLAITGGLTYEFAIEATSARFDVSSMAVPNGTVTLETWTCDVGDAFPFLLGSEHEFQLQCVMLRASRWLWILLWLFAMGPVVGGILDARGAKVLIGRRGGSEKRRRDAEAQHKTRTSSVPNSRPGMKETCVPRVRQDRFA